VRAIEITAPGKPEVLRETDGTLRLVRRRQTFDQILQNEG